MTTPAARSDTPPVATSISTRRLPVTAAMSCELGDHAYSPDCTLGSSSVAPPPAVGRRKSWLAPLRDWRTARTEVPSGDSFAPE